LFTVARSEYFTEIKHPRTSLLRSLIHRLTILPQGSTEWLKHKKLTTAYRVGQNLKKRGYTLMTIILSILNRFKIFFIERFLGKFAVKWISKITPHSVYVATLPCETLTSAKQAINDKLQGSVATYLRCGRVVNNQSNYC